MERVANWGISVEQDEKTTRLVLEVGGDRKVCLLQYDRKLINSVQDEVTVFEWNSDGSPSSAGMSHFPEGTIRSLVGVLVSVSREFKQENDAA